MASANDIVKTALKRSQNGVQSDLQLKPCWVVFDLNLSAKLLPFVTYVVNLMNKPSVKANNNCTLNFRGSDTS